ncbi:restriction endonuclease subunit S [Marinobacter sp. tcs-11]|jgi:type I restriction enzyme S subunit|uniref:restriction endonuclease subunit S n=1 Tax=Marinobacter sp. tcs-11 TaxID=1742860 RepID=UPI00257EE043|nr:restriction endonuclease subunit S [Marinobacter sp. tcs-11]
MSRFPPHWHVLPFIEAVKDVTAGNPKLPKQDYLNAGTYPVVDQGQSLFGGYTDDPGMLANAATPAIVFGDHTRLFKFISEPFCLGADGAKILEPKADLDKKFLYHYLRSLRIESAGYSRHFKFLKENVVPVPSLSEQKRIATILDKADAIRRKRQEAIQLADEFLRAVFLDMFGDPVTNPKGWRIVELGSLIDPEDKLNYGVVQPGEHDSNGIPLVRSGDLGDRPPELSSLRRVSNAIDRKHRKSRLKGNEILIACVGSIGKVGWVSDGMKGWNIARAVTRIPVRESVNREYLYRYLQNPVVQGYFARETRAVAQPTLNVGLIAKTPIALPSEDLQHEFLKQYEKISQLKREQSLSLRDQESLFGSLSQNAFSGDL